MKKVVLSKIKLTDNNPIILKDDKLIIKEQTEMVLINKLPKRYSINI